MKGYWAVVVTVYFVPPLCIGVILLVFNPSGKVPLVRLKLKIWERGTLISLAMVLSICDFSWIC